MMKDIDFCDVERYSTVILTFQHFTSAHKKTCEIQTLESLLVKQNKDRLSRVCLHRKQKWLASELQKSKHGLKVIIITIINIQ